MPQIDIEGLNQFRSLEAALNPRNINTAVRMATNDTLRKGRTWIRRAIQDVYNIKAKRINDTDKHKGVTLKLASTSDPKNGQINAGHKPVNISNLSRIRQTKTGLSVEVMKGKRTIIQRAFMLNKIPFARGQYFSTGFGFRHGKGSRVNTTGPDTPIESLNTVSIATAALNTRAFRKYDDKVTSYHRDELTRQISRLIERKTDTLF